jgi:integrase
LRNFLSAVFKYAVNVNKCERNPVTEVITPKGLPAQTTHAYTLDEITAMLAVLGEPAKTLMLTAALTGLRRSELQGLRWEDFTGTELNVSRSVWKGIEGGTKNTASKGAVPLLPVLAEALAQHKARNGYNEWVFHGETGQPVRLDNLTRRDVIPVLQKAGLVWHGWHAFRRGLASNLFELGAEPKYAQAVLRHASEATTRLLYIKPRDKRVAEAMDKVAEAFRQSTDRAKRA